MIYLYKLYANKLYIIFHNFIVLFFNQMKIWDMGDNI